MECRDNNKESKKKQTAKHARIEGQIRGIKAMVENNRECDEILVQINAVNSALNNVARDVLYNHIEHCMHYGVSTGNTDDAMEELQYAIEQFVKMK